MRTFVSERSLSSNASRDKVCSGCPSGIGQIRTVPSTLVEADEAPGRIDPNTPDGCLMADQEVRLFSGDRTDPHDPIPAASHHAHS